MESLNACFFIFMRKVEWNEVQMLFDREIV